MATTTSRRRMRTCDIDIPALEKATLKLHDHIEFLRYEDRPKGMNRADTLEWLGDEIDRMKDFVDLPGGWTNPEDPFSDMALVMLRLEYHELTRPDNPYPIPRDDPRPRTAAGKLIVLDNAFPPIDEHEAVHWSPTSPLWKKFVKGSRVGRFWLMGGGSITVVPILATPPKGCENWIRPEDFWNKVDTLSDTKWIPFCGEKALT